MNDIVLRTAPALVGEMRDAEDHALSAAHLKRLADRMAPDPREWSYDGECNDAGGPTSKCACGHPIRYEFAINRPRDGARLVIGSTCIRSSVPYLMACGAGDLAAALEAAVAKLQAALAEAERRIRDAVNSDRVAAILAEREKVVAWIKEAATREAGRPYDARRWLPSGAGSFMRRPPAALSTPGRTAAAAARAVGTMLAALLASGDWPDCPEPTEPEVRRACGKELRRRAEDVRAYAHYRPDPAAERLAAGALDQMAARYDPPGP